MILVILIFDFIILSCFMKMVQVMGLTDDSFLVCYARGVNATGACNIGMVDSNGNYTLLLSLSLLLPAHRPLPTGSCAGSRGLGTSLTL